MLVCVCVCVYVCVFKHVCLSACVCARTCVYVCVCCLYFVLLESQYKPNEIAGVIYELVNDLIFESRYLHIIL